MNDLVLRLMAAFFVGTLISQAGSSVQFLTRNKLASPSTLGFDGVSVLMVTIFYFFIGIFSIYVSQSILIIIGCVFLIGISSFYGKMLIKKDGAILLGLSINLFSGALFSIIQFLFFAYHLNFPSEVWFGHFKFVELYQVILMFLAEIIFILFFFLNLRKIQILSLFHLRPHLILSIMFIFSAITTFLIIFYFGAFAFLGLLFPLLSRFIFFHKFDLVGEFVYGALLNGVVVMLIDWLCYSFPIQGAELPVGLFLSFFGSLCLITLLFKQQALRNIGKKLN